MQLIWCIRCKYSISDDQVSPFTQTQKKIKEVQRKAYIDPEIALQEKEKGNEFFKKGIYRGSGFDHKYLLILKYEWQGLNSSQSIDTWPEAWPHVCGHVDQTH